MDIDYKHWFLRLNEVSSELMRARSLSQLLSTILSETRELTASDAGSVYRINREVDPPELIFDEAQNDSVDLPDRTITLPLDRSSLAGYAALEGEVLNIDDVYELPEDKPYSFDRGVDESLGYRTRSMLVLPLENREGMVRGVLQLINRKKDGSVPLGETEVLPYPDALVDVVEPFSYQAAVALERAELDESIQSMIDSIIQTLVNALDQRDKITTGHSRRVAGYGYHLARAINRREEGPMSDEQLDEEQIRQLFYAGLLHDIGKIVVPEDVLNKQNRLSPETMSSLYYRLAYLEESGQFREADAVYSRIESINTSGFLAEEDEEFLKELQEEVYEGPDGEETTVLTEEEYRNLSVKRGNLTERQREVMQSHARVTYDILSEIDWTSELDEVPGLAASHHERLDGSGYPWGKTLEDLPLIARILAVVDVYEALTARDRPYRDAMEHERARDVLLEEADENHLDPDLVDLFLDEDVHEQPVEDLPDLGLA